MKVLKNNYQETNIEEHIKEEDIKQEKPYPRKLICEKCGSELEYEKSDIRIGVLGCVFVDCPLCKHDNMLEDNENNIALTANNVEFPVHFWRFSTETGAVDCCNNEMIREYILKAIDYFRTNKEEYSYGGHITGNFYINVRRWSGDEMYEVTVSNDFYSTEIPFESEDY